MFMYFMTSIAFAKQIYLIVAKSLKQKDTYLNMQSNVL